MIPQVGDVLFRAYREPRDQGLEHEIVVTKVGRKWAEFARTPRVSRLTTGRFDHTDPRWPVGASRGYTDSSRVWSSREAWAREKERDQAYQFLRSVMHHGNLHPDVTLENVREAARLLGVGAKFEAELARTKP